MELKHNGIKVQGSKISILAGYPSEANCFAKCQTLQLLYIYLHSLFAVEMQFVHNFLLSFSKWMKMQFLQSPILGNKSFNWSIFCSLPTTSTIEHMHDTHAKCTNSWIIYHPLKTCLDDAQCTSQSELMHPHQVEHTQITSFIPMSSKGIFPSKEETF